MTYMITHYPQDRPIEQSRHEMRPVCHETIDGVEIDTFVHRHAHKPTVMRIDYV